MFKNQCFINLCILVLNLATRHVICHTLEKEFHAKAAMICVHIHDLFSNMLIISTCDLQC